MKIGITGGTGFIGQYLLKECVNEHEFRVAYSGKSERRLFEHENIAYFVSDYSQESFEKIFKGCDAIVHLGAKRPSKENEESILSYTENIVTAEHLFKAAVNQNITNIINVSSRSVYSSDLHLPFTEDVTKPYNNYGVIKLAVENMANIYNNKYNMRIKSLRLAQVLGLNEKPGLISTVFFERCVRKETLYVYGKGVSAKEYIYVKDVVNAILCSCRKADISGSFNIGTSKLVSNYELAEIYCHVLSNNAGISCLEDKAEDNMRFVMDISKAKGLLGFEPRYSVEEAIRDMVKEYYGEMAL